MSFDMNLNYKYLEPGIKNGQFTPDLMKQKCLISTLYIKNFWFDKSFCGVRKNRKYKYN